MSCLNVFAISDHQTECSSHSKHKQDNTSIYLVFDVNQVNVLRKQYHMCGQTVGMSTNTDQRKQLLAVPVQFTREELAVLIENSGVHVNVYHSMCADLSIGNNEKVQVLKQKYDSYVSSLIDKQNSEFATAQNEKLATMRSKILEGKSKKLNQRLAQIDAKLRNSAEDSSLEAERENTLNLLKNLEASFDSELEAKKSKSTSQLAESSVGLTTTHIFIGTPEFYRSFYPVSLIANHNVLNKACYESCKYKAYKYLWNKGIWHMVIFKVKKYSKNHNTPLLGINIFCLQI